MDLSAVAVELYELLPSEFTAARGVRAKEAKTDGDAELARRIGRLPKPSAAAWAVNRLAREKPEEIDAVLELGAALRRAQEEHDSAALRELGQQRSRVLSAAVREVRSVAEGHGVNVSDAAADDIEETLRAAMVDVGAAMAVRSGQLVKTLSTNGLDPVDLSQAVAVPEALPEGLAEPVSDVERQPGPAGKPEPARKPATGAKTETADAAKRPSAKEREERKRAEEEARQQREREEALEALEEAEGNAEQAEADLAEAEGEATEATGRRDKLTAEIAQLKEQLAELQEDLAAAEKVARFAERSRSLAERLAVQERRNVERARQRLEQLR